MSYVNNIEHSKEKLIKTIDNMQRIDTSWALCKSMKTIQFPQSLGKRKLKPLQI